MSSTDERAPGRGPARVTGDRNRPADPERRKHQVLTKGRASVVGSIADAVTVKDGEPFFLCRPDGQVPIDGGHGYGLYHQDCRFLAGYELRIAGRAPDALVAAETSATTLTVELTNPPTHDGVELGKEQLGITWRRHLDRRGPTLHDELRLHNYGRQEATVPLSLRFRGGFEDVFAIRGLLDLQPGRCHEPSWEDGSLTFRYEGGDDVTRVTCIRFDRQPDDRLTDGATFRLVLDPGGDARLHVTVELTESGRSSMDGIAERGSPARQPTPNAARMRQTAPHDPEGDWLGGRGWQCSVRTSSFALRAALGRSLDDLAQLRSELGGQRYYEAGIPWFATLFGRDSLIAGLQTLAFDTGVAAETLRLLAGHQGTRVDAWRDEAPGKILHELRIGELARMGEIPHTPYYGTVDATPLFLVLLARHAAWTGSLDLFRELRGSVDAALGWMEHHADTDGDGFLDYRGGTDRGLVNQGWKDSGDAIVTEDGKIATPPIALAEVQGYAWRAWRDTAGLLERDGDERGAGRLRERAEAMRRRFEEAFWSESLGCYVLALAAGRPCRVVSSNAGQVLWSGIAAPERARAVAGRLLREDMFNGWGIRTLSSQAAAYHPVGYHLGTVWPHDNALIAEGFRHYGLDAEAEAVFLGLLEASADFTQERLPECFAGFAREEFGIPVRYPVACHPQAWAAGALPQLLVATLGLEPDGFAGTLLVRRPSLPEGIERVDLAGVRVGSGSASLRFERHGGGATTLEVLETSGGLRVDREEAPAPGGDLHRASTPTSPSRP